MQILIAEDDHILSLVLENMIRRMGHEVVFVCRNGKNTIKQALSKKPDCILLDYFLMDDLNGYQVMVKIRQQLQIPVVFITGQPLNLIKVKTDEIKYSVCITKPVLYHDLEKAIENLVNQK